MELINSGDETPVAKLYVSMPIMPWSEIEKKPEVVLPESYLNS